MISETKKKSFHYGWVMVFVGFLITWFIGCIYSSAAGMMVKPVSEDFGISRSRFSLGTTFNSIGGMIMSAIVGKLYKRFSLKKVVLASAVVFALCYGSMGFAPNIYMFYVLSFIAGFALVAASMVGVGTMLSRWFNEKRGLAMAIASSGSGVGGVVMNPVIGRLVTSIGWRKTYMAIGIMVVAVLVPAITLLMKESPARAGMQPYGAEKSSVTGGKDLQQSGMMAAQALKTPMFFMLIPIIVSISATSNCVMQHTVAYATDIGFEYTAAAGIASVLTAGLAIGKLVLGQLFDTLGSRKACTVSLSIYTLSMLIYFGATMEMPALMYTGSAIWGMGGSFAAVASSLIVQDIFGKKDYANIFGYISICSSLGGAVGPTLMASAFDAMGTYKPSWLVCAGIMVVNIILLGIVFTQKNRYNKKHS